MPIDHPSDLPGDRRPPAGDPGREADEWRAADDTPQPSHEAEPRIDAGQRGEQPTDAEGTGYRPDNSHAAEDPASPADPADRSTDTRTDDSPAEGGASNSEEPPRAEARTRQEHADTTPADRPGGDPELSGSPVNGQMEGREQTSSNKLSNELHQALEARPAPDQMPPDAVSEDSPDNPANEYLAAEEESQPAGELALGTDPGPLSPPDPSGSDDLATLAALSHEAPAPQVEESEEEVGPEPTLITDFEPTDDMEQGAEKATDGNPTEFGDPTPETDTPVSALTEKEWADHLVEVRDKLEKAHSDGLATDHVYTIDPDHLRWTRERRHLHHDIVDAIYSRAFDVPCDHSAIMAGGLGGAGKTTTLREQAGVDLSQYLTINPDDIKEEMAKRGLVPVLPGLSPMEASDLVHEESSAIAKQLARRAYAEGKNLVWDITMSSHQSTEQRIDEMRESGYIKS